MKLLEIGSGIASVAIFAAWTVAVLPPAQQHRGLPESTLGMIYAGNRYPGIEVTKGEPHELLVGLAREHAESMARRDHQDHAGSNRREARIRAELGLSAKEICAETWRHQDDWCQKCIAWEFFHCWRQSPGHWSVASGRHRYWGGYAAQGRSGRHFGCIIVAD